MPEGTEQQQQQEAQQQQAAQRPVWLPEKFKSPEDLARSYGELEKELTRRAKPGPLDDPAAANPFAADDFTPDAVLSRVGLTEEQVAAAIAANDGKVPADLYAKFKSAGAGKGMVDDYIALRATTRAQLTERAKAEGLAVAGGQQQLNTLFEFGKGLPADVKADLNARLSDPRRHAAAVVELKGHYDLAVSRGTVKSLIDGSPAGGSAAAAAYRTQADYYRGAQAAKTSGDERAKHEARVRASEPIYTLPRD